MSVGHDIAMEFSLSKQQLAYQREETRKMNNTLNIYVNCCEKRKVISNIFLLSKLSVDYYTKSKINVNLYFIIF